MNTLNKILLQKHKEVEELKSLVPVKLLEQSLFFELKPVSLKNCLARADKVGIIAEFKRRSPSKGMINPNVPVEQTTIGYVQAGASALSILTDEPFFGGSNNDLEVARKFNTCPILRKDFIIDEYQILEAKSIGADANLLIAATLDSAQVEEYTTLAHELDMEVLLEVHNKKELEANDDTTADLIGVNNRNLKTFEVDINVSRELGELIPSDKVRISESGIHEVSAILDLIQYGYKGFLIGEQFMRECKPEVACKEFISQLKLGAK
jgi:indole-3-glycerol phosphate synthase